MTRTLSAPEMSGVRSTQGGRSFVARVSRDRDRPIPLRKDEVLVIDSPHYAGVETRGFRACLFVGTDEAARVTGDGTAVVPLPSRMEYLTDGDVVRVDLASGQVRVLYRLNSRHNSLFVTERCNSNCVMCAQPPKPRDDSFMVRDCYETVRLMSKNASELCITGGEPTLLGAELVTLLAFCRDSLPATSLHLLSNGRLFKYLTFAEAIAEVGHPDLMIGIPLYSDLAGQHDFIVQSERGFDETVRGILNLARCEQHIEVRVVVHRYNVDRLPALGRFIGRNLPFVRQVALMGLELMGHARTHLNLVWADPTDYVDLLRETVMELLSHRVYPVIYNHQLCTLPRDLWPFSAKSISDYKNIFFPECKGCAVRWQCGGFFSASQVRRSRAVRAISDAKDHAKMSTRYAESPRQESP